MDQDSSQIAISSNDFMSRLLGNSAFKESIDGHLNLALRISRDSHAHETAKELVPIAEIVQNNVDVIVDGDFNDNLLPFLVQWFSTEFFRWFKVPDCERCKVPLNFSHKYADIQGRLVERYGCSKASSCDYTFDFIRHNDPSILLHTRVGRCGEWAHCFYVILRALDYDARIVYDSTDHVWNEVFSKTKDRWVHVDPCENTVDTPLLYEVGWSKKLQYCIAYSPYEVVDVTRRYVINYECTKKIRNECSESWLERYLTELTIKLIKNLDSDRLKADLSQRRLKEIDSLRSLGSSPREIPDKSRLRGRKTGSIAWRIERGEYCPSSKNLKVISVTKCDNHVPGGQLFHLAYDCHQDLYKSSHTDYTDKKSWCSLTYEYKNVDYKYERDWMTSYIARYETCPADKNGEVVWRFDISKLESFSRLEVLFRCKIYPCTHIAITLSCYGSSTEDKLADFPISPNQTDVFTCDKLGSQVKLIDLIAVLSGGDCNDDVAWQKPQLFRQTQGEGVDEIPFSIKFY